MTTHRSDAGQPLCARRSDGGTYVNGHYAWVESVLDAAVGPCAIGRTAVYSDAIPWKNRHLPRPTKTLRALALRRVQRIMEALQPGVLLTLGGFAASLAGQHLDKASSAHVVGLGGWEGACIAAYHPAAWFRRGEWTPYEERLRQAIAAACRSG